MNKLRTILFVFSFGTSLLLITGGRVSNPLACEQEEEFSQENAQASAQAESLAIFALPDEEPAPLFCHMHCCNEMALDAQNPARFFEEGQMLLMKENGICPPVPIDEIEVLIPPELQGKIAFIGIPDKEPPAMRAFLQSIRLRPADLHFTAEQRKSLRQLEKAYFESLRDFMLRTDLEAADIIPLEKMIRLLERRAQRVAFHILKPMQNAFFDGRLWRDKTTRIWDDKSFQDGETHSHSHRSCCAESTPEP